MDKQTQDRLWSSLPKEAREEIKNDYNSHPTAYHPYFNEGYDEALKIYFGKHNLTSDTEPAELLFVERKKVVDLYATMDKAFPREAAYSVQKALESLFGDKCLPDKPSVQVEPKLDILPCRGERLIITNKTNDKLAMSIGDKFTVISSWKGTMQSVAHRIYLRIRQDNGYVRVINSDKYSWKPYTEPETKDNTQLNSWEAEFKKMNECFEKIQKPLSSLCDTFGKLEASVNKLNRL